MQLKGSILRRVLPLMAAIAAMLAFAGPASADNYVAMGDSYSSGTGTGSYTINSACKRGVYAYPYLLKQARANTSLNFVACSGATTSTVTSGQLGALNSSTGFATITVGGNDVGFANLIVSCTTFGCGSAITNSNNQINGILPGRLATLFSSMKARAPQARFIVLGYPRVFGSYGCFSTTGISSSERTSLNNLANNLNSKIATAAANAGFTYKDANTTFAGHFVCSSSGEYINGLNIWSTSESYHPNRNGNRYGYLPLVRQVVG